MEVTDFDLGEIDSLVVKLMGHAAMARAYGDAMQRDPALVGGFGKLADRHRAAVRTLCGEIERTAAAFAGAAAIPFPKLGRR
jgi:hypothetical protein